MGAGMTTRPALSMVVFMASIYHARNQGFRVPGFQSSRVQGFKVPGF
jgi:hypothetical protein